MTTTQKLLYAQALVLAGGTAFAWYQWYLEYFKHCEACSGEEVPLFSKCFLGAVFFTLALVLNLILVFKAKNE